MVTFFLICLGWVFFRADSINDACWILMHMATGWHLIFSGDGLSQIAQVFRIPLRELVLLGLAIVLLEAAYALHVVRSLIERAAAYPLWFRWVGYYFLLGGVLFSMLANLDGGHRFIYFQF